jgi:hypothetical protein
MRLIAILTVTAAFVLSTLVTGAEAKKPGPPKPQPPKCTPGSTPGCS